MKRVLQVVDSMDMGGIQTFLMNVYRQIDRNEIQFDFLVFRNHKQVFEDEIRTLGGKIYKLPKRRDGIIKNRKAIRLFFDEHHEYDTIHFHASSLTDIGVLKEAYRRNIPKRIVHSHSTRSPGNKLHKYIHNINKKNIDKCANYYFACGELAAEWLFSGTTIENRVVLVSNGIECKAYKYNKATRDQVRNELCISNKYVIGNIGRFSEVKNHRFLINVFAKVVERYSELNPTLMLIGTGEQYETIRELVKTLNLENRVLFMGTRHDVPRLLQAFDVMIMPSIYEGFPVTAIEAQATGVHCVLSNTITKEVLIKNNVEMLGLNDPIDVWAEHIMTVKERIVDNTVLVKAGYDIETTKNQLIGVYLKEIES